MEIAGTLGFKMALVAGMTQGVFFLFALNKVKDRPKLASQLLSCIFVILILSIAGRFAYDLQVHQKFPHLFLFVDFSLFVFGPLFYFYTQSVLDPDFRVTKALRIHFVPAGVHLISLTIQFSIDPNRFFELVQNRNALLYNTWYVFEGLSILSVCIYLVLTLRSLSSENAADDKKGEGGFSIKYFRVLTGLMMLSMVIWITSFVTLLVTGHRLTWAFDLTWLPMILINFVIGYYMIIKPDFFKARPAKTIRIADRTLDPKLELLSKKMMDFLKTEKPFLNPELSVNQLALMLEIKPHVATKVMTQALKTNFFELINTHRINEFVRLASEDGQQQTYLAIAFEVGFNSKTTFNKAFKREKGVSPREYFKLNQVG